MKKRVEVIICLFVLYLFFLNPGVSFSGNWTVYTDQKGLPIGDVRVVAEDPGGYLWMAVRDRDNPEEGTVVALDPADEFISLSYGSHPSCLRDINGILFEDIPGEEFDNYELGSVWFASSCGINTLDRTGGMARLYSRNTPLPGNNIKAIFSSHDSTKWVSVWGKGVCCVDSDFNWTEYSRSDGLCSRFINAIAEDNEGNVWFGSNDRGVCMLDMDSNWVHFSSANSGLICDRVFSIVPQPPNRVWFVTHDGLSVFDGRNWMSYTSRNSPMANYVPTCFVIDSAGNRWIGTDRGGLFRMDRFGMWSHFSMQNSSLPSDGINTMIVDSHNNLWIGTTSGLCRFSGAAVSQHTMPSGSSSAGSSDYQPFEHAYVWENTGKSGTTSELSFSLPVFPQGAKACFYAGLWADHDFNFMDMQYSIESDRLGNMKLRLKGKFSDAEFLVSGGVVDVENRTVPDRKTRHPYPATYPVEVRNLLLPGRHIPSNDPEIKALAVSLAGSESPGDMYKSMRDIVYSQLVQNMGFTDSDTGLLKQGSQGRGNAATGHAEDVSYVLKHNKGGRHAKARLLCTLARAVGIPARIVESISGDVWCQAWISGSGWIPVEASYPVCDYVRKYRTYMPRQMSGDDVIAAVSGRDDDTGVVMWDKGTSAYYSVADPEGLKGPGQTRDAKLILMTIVSAGKVPDDAMVNVTDRISVCCRQTQDNVVLVFQDVDGRQIKTLPLVFDGLSSFVNIENKFFWNFTPRRLGNILVIENLKCSILSGYSPSDRTEADIPDNASSGSLPEKY